MAALESLANHLVSGCKAFLRAHAVLDFVLVSLFGPNLEALIESAQEMGPDLVVDNAHNSATSVLARQTDIHFRLAGLRVVGYAGWRHLFSLEIQTEMVLEIELVNVVLEQFFSFFLADDLSLRLEVGGLTAESLNERVENLLGNLHKVLTRLSVILQELLSAVVVFILELGVVLTIGFKKQLLLLVQITWHHVRQSLRILLLVATARIVLLFLRLLLLRGGVVLCLGLSLHFFGVLVWLLLV